MGKKTSTDKFMQFGVIKGVLTSSSDDLVSANLNTNLSIRGGLAWLIHVVEFIFEGSLFSAAFSSFDMSLSTVKGETVIPDIDDKGVIAFSRFISQYASSGAYNPGAMPKVLSFLPPVPIASPNLTLYGKCSTDAAAMDATAFKCRFGFTTISLDDGMYTEIAETWGMV